MDQTVDTTCLYTSVRTLVGSMISPGASMLITVCYLDEVATEMVVTVISSRLQLKQG